MITVIGGIKGGSGKTTIATNLAVMRSAHTKVLLVDADEQKSSWDWSQQRDHVFSTGKHGRIFTERSFVTVCMSGKSIHANLMKLQEDYDDIIVDTGGRDTTSQRSALCVADTLILPFKPSSIDVWTMSPIKVILSECVNSRLKVYAIISQADSIGRDNKEAIEILKEFTQIETLDFTIGNRKAFRNAASEGLGIIEMSPVDKKAFEEIEQLYLEIYS